MSLLRTENISKLFYQGTKQLTILENVNLTVEKGEVLAITGISGVGKSTLLHMMGALDRPTTGQVFLNEENVFCRPDRELARFRNQFIGFVFQFHHLLPEFSAWENVLLPLLINQVPLKVAREKAAAILAEVGLTERLNHRPGKLSGGEQQRVAIARALVNEPTLLLADEPTGNLDEDTAAKVLDLFWQLNRGKGITLVLVTHNEAIAQAANRRYKIHEKHAQLEP